MKVSIIILLLILLSVSHGKQMVSNYEDKKLIKNLISEFMEKVSHNNLGRGWYDKYFSGKDEYLGSELPYTNFHLVDDLWIDQVIVDNNSASVCVNFSRLAIFDINKITVKNDTAKVYYSLKKYKQVGWKIEFLLEKSDISILRYDDIGYINIFIEIFNPYNKSKESYKYPYWQNMHQNLKIYYHTEFRFSVKYLRKLGFEELNLRRNEIYAHYGRIFKTPWLQEHFEKQSWYKPNPDYSDSLLTENDKANIQLILQVEKEKKGEY